VKRWLDFIPKTLPVADSQTARDMNKGFSASGAWICHTGKVRKVNEDACLFGGTFSGASASAPIKVKLDESEWIIAVADGIGGHRAGAFASREVVVALSMCDDFSTDGVDKVLQDTNIRLHKAGAANPELTGTGTTVCGVLASAEGLYAFNVGDARLYRQEGGKITQVTRDDSVEQMLVSEGLLVAHDGIRASTMHALTQSVGGSRDLHELDPHFHPMPLSKPARFILCTDGLSDMLSVKEMERVVVPVLSPAGAVQALFTSAMDAGGRDNITIAVVDVDVR
jgi:PPM family protein phosphatase